MNYFNMYPGDYARDTGDLLLAEHGAYCLILMRYYASDGDIPTDFERLCRMCGAVSTDEVDAVRAVLARFFVMRQGKWRNKKADKEIAKAAPRIRAARMNGKKGGRPNQDLTNPMGNPLETQPAPHAGVGKGVGVGVGEQSKASSAFALSTVTKIKSPAAGGRGGK